MSNCWHVVDGINVIGDHTPTSYDKFCNCQRFLDFLTKAIWNWNLGKIDNAQNDGAFTRAISAP